MKFSQFFQQVNSGLVGSQVVSNHYCFEHIIQSTADGVILVDRCKTDYESLEEAVANIKQQRLSKQLEEEIYQEQYLEISDNKIVDIIKQYHNDIRVTDTLLESYVELASSKRFTVDNVALDIRSLNKIDRLIENKIDIHLDDGFIIAISEQLHRSINNIFAGHLDVVEYMQSSKDNFLDVLNQIEG